MIHRTFGEHQRGYVDASGEASVPDDIDSDVLMPFLQNLKQ
jgi:hypothetical protein